MCKRAHLYSPLVAETIAETPADRSLQFAFAEIVGHTSELVDSECYYSVSVPFQDSDSPSVSKTALTDELNAAEFSNNNPQHSFTSLSPWFTRSRNLDKPFFTTLRSGRPDLFAPIFAPHSPPDTAGLLSTDSRTLQQSGSTVSANDADFMAEDLPPNLSEKFLAKFTDSESPTPVKFAEPIRSTSLPSHHTAPHPILINPHFRSPSTDYSSLLHFATPQNSCIHHPILLRFTPTFRSPTVPNL